MHILFLSAIFILVVFLQEGKTQLKKEISIPVGKRISSSIFHKKNQSISWYQLFFFLFKLQFLSKKLIPHRFSINSSVFQETRKLITGEYGDSSE